MGINQAIPLVASMASTATRKWNDTEARGGCQGTISILVAYAGGVNLRASAAQTYITSDHRCASNDVDRAPMCVSARPKTGCQWLGTRRSRSAEADPTCVTRRDGGTAAYDFAKKDLQA